MLDELLIVGSWELLLKASVPLSPLTELPASVISINTTAHQSTHREDMGEGCGRGGDFNYTVL